MLLFSPAALHGQSAAPLQGWSQIYLKHKTTHNWLWEADAGFRVHSPHLERNTALGRIGFGRQFKDFSATAGIAYFETWPRYGAQSGLGEFRLYQKLVIPQKIGPLNLNHIYRAEERWFQHVSKTQLRLRYQLQAVWEVKKMPVLKANPFLIGHTEIFLRPDQTVFSQFRLFGGLGLNWANKWRADLGYLAIYLPRPGGGTVPQQALRTTLTYSW